METILQFIYVFFRGVLTLSPILLVLTATIVTIGIAIGRLEKWSKIDSVYFAFITATTVGYGDFRPRRSISKVAAIVIALIGLILTGIIVAIALFALESSLVDHGIVKGE